jgi:hypothetical protein
MHPSRSDLRRYCDQRLVEPAARTVAEHLAVCEFCREYCEEHRALTQAIDREAGRTIAALDAHRIDEIHRKTLAGMVVELATSIPVAADEPALLAADGGSQVHARLENLGTLYSENPEVVLRIMRDNSRQQDYLQLVSEDEHLVSRVLVQVPELELNVLTDQYGRGDIEWSDLRDFARYGWRVKLPDAEFSLSPLQYDPEKVEYHEETILETERGDRLGIRFEGRTEGKRLTVRILQFEGRSDFDTVRVVVSQATESVSRNLSRADALDLELSSPDDLIAIRLFSE